MPSPAGPRLGDKVSVPKFAEPLAVIKADTLRDSKASYDYKADSKVHPLPELRPDKALVVVVCPFIDDPISRGPLVKLYANGRVVAVNNFGSRSDPAIELHLEVDPHSAAPEPPPHYFTI